MGFFLMEQNTEAAMGLFSNVKGSDGAQTIRPGGASSDRRNAEWRAETDGLYPKGSKNAQRMEEAGYQALQGGSPHASLN
jgi:hypothetical protein